jgi:hypothetical protein
MPMDIGRRQGSSVSSRLEDLRDLARMLDEGKISQGEYDIVKTEIIQAPADEWESQVGLGPPVVGERHDEEPATGWWELVGQVPRTYRVAAVGALVVLVAGFFLGGRGDAAGSVTVDRVSVASLSSSAAPGSLGFRLDGLADGWNAVPDPPLITGGVRTTPEPGQLDSFLHRFDRSSLVAGAFDPGDGSVYALMAQSETHDSSMSSLYVHLCYLLHPGSQGCLDTFIEQTGTFGKSHALVALGEQRANWVLEGNKWQVDIRDDVETIRVQAATSP